MMKFLRFIGFILIILLTPFMIAIGLIAALCITPFSDSLKQFNEAVLKEEENRRELEET